MIAHTPTPWFVGAQNDALYVISGRAPSLNNDDPWHDAPREPVAMVYGDKDAAHIVRCVNAHDELVAALKEIAGKGDSVNQFARIARAALAKVAS